MSTLLKSVQAAARATPAYRYYARKQSPETFVIFYRVGLLLIKMFEDLLFKMFEGEPDLSLLGEERRPMRLGCLPSPYGSLNVDLYYRTRMEITPNTRLETEMPKSQLKGKPFFIYHSF